ncbi:carboxypeptidase-like regulatory domain-containing protein [Longimicrobium sp.]|uniref:carboxypeptidase-like regulatory domain-containing protein n=1 Tax=Longimicrobium sp. TaxID=2029185 RepID=UPI002CCB75C7|nr:carboxypeptidase-like regulatory domain-containing protein [Longimicrobium sp.]HSU12838.1 carboxypeptidase-like regulatory domain-containing protein [Longimicrobium sp.]
MRVRLKLGIAAACTVLAAAACDGANAFTGSEFGRNGGGAAGVGTIQGQVTEDGAGAGGVSVILVGQDSTVTNGAGVFTFTSVPSSTYSVAVQVPLGFALVAGQTATRTVTVTDGATTGVTFNLQSTTTVP